MKLCKVIILLIFVQTSVAQKIYRTQPVSHDIKTVKIVVNGDAFAPPVIQINSDEQITLKFDKLSIEEPRLRYRIIHCNADWTASDISEIEYLNGFNDQLIEDYRFSENTTVNYIHYQLNFPNSATQLKLPGNYAVIVSDDSNPDNILLTACFSVLDPKLRISAAISGNTDIDINREHQQLAFEINHTALPLRDPMNELFVTVQQNNRMDNKRSNLKPTYIHPNRLVFEHNPLLIFEAGNEYRRFETVSRQYNGLNIYETFFDTPFIHSLVYKDDFRSRKARQYDEDQNGRFFVRNADAYDSDVEADYFMVHFTLSGQASWEEIFLNGEFTYNTFSDNNKMIFNQETNEYNGALLLKQGAYNYQYLAPALKGFSTSSVEGNYYDTENEYLILVYHRAPGRRFDRLVGMLQIK